MWFKHPERFRIPLGRSGILSLLLLVLLAYLNSFAGTFQFDDFTVISRSSSVHSFHGWIEDLATGIRPLLKLTYLLNNLSGSGPTGFHLVNILIHCINTLLLYGIAIKFTWSKAASLLAAGIFALHPLQTEAVTYICGRSASLAATFYLGGLLAYAGAGEGATSRTGQWLAPLFFIFAMLVKETAVTFPAALLLWDLSKGRTVRDHLRNSWPCWIVLLTAAVGLLTHPRYSLLMEYSFSIRPWWENMAAQVTSISYLFSRLIILNGMNIDPDLTGAIHPAAFYGEVISLSALTAIGILSIKYRPWLAFGILWFLLHLLPTNSIIPRLDLVNDRQAYLPLAGLAIGAGMGGEKLLRRCRPLLAGLTVALLMITLAFFTMLRNRDYGSEIALWEDTARKSPEKARVHNNLGYAYFLAGRNAPARHEFLEAIRLAPDYTLARSNLAGNETAIITGVHRLAGSAIMPLPLRLQRGAPIASGRAD